MKETTCEIIDSLGQYPKDVIHDTLITLEDITGTGEMSGVWHYPALIIVAVGCYWLIKRWEW